MKTAGMLSAVAALSINATLLYTELNVLVSGQLAGVLVGRTLLGVCAGGVSVIMLWIFAVVVNAAYVRGRGERYAKSLLGACERGGV
jgi:hypothetical protein